MLMAAAVGYGRRAYAACVNTGGSTYECSGVNVTQQAINANNATVFTDPGFSVTTAAAGAITITGDGALSYTDVNASPLTAPSAAALYVRSGGNYAATPGSVTINTNGVLTGGIYGVDARNFGTGALTVTVNGNVTGTGTFSPGIFALNYGTGLSVTTGAGTTVRGGRFGISATNRGTGALTITANGDVTGTSIRGIFAFNSAAGTGLSVTTAAGKTVSGGTYGIFADNRGSGALIINANGTVTGSSGQGIYARNSAAGTGLSVTTGAGAVSGGRYGIYARNSGTGALSINANGNVTGTSILSSGIYARNSAAGTSLSVTTGGTVSGGIDGIHARNYGSGALTVTANGNVTGGSARGIYARNAGVGTDLRVTTGAGTMVSGRYGILALSVRGGALSITANGDVTGTVRRGIYARNLATGTDLSVTTGAGTTVGGATDGIFARLYGTGALTITANGDVTGTSGRGIYAFNSAAGTGLSVTTAAGTTVSGATYGINARNFGTGALTITANGNVTAATGIRAASGGIPIGITVSATGTVTGSAGTAIATSGGPATVTVAGTVNGGISFDQGAAFADRLELKPTAVINGNVLGGPGTDTLGLSGTSGSGSFDVSKLVAFEAGAKTEGSTWTLTGTNAGITAFSVAAGTLAVNGSLSNAAFTVTGGTLTGTGTVGNTSIAGGTFQPGSGTAGSSMTVNGTLSFNAASTYAINVNPTTASFANVSGAATLAGTVNAIFAPGSYIAKQYTILTAASINGAFDALTNTNLPANFHDTLSYDATHAYLNLILNFSTPASGTLNGNQNNVANALINFFDTTGGIPMAFAMLNAAGLSQASGEAGADVAQTGIDATKQFIGAIFDGAFDDNNALGGATGFAPEGGQANAYAPKKKAADDAAKVFAKAMPVKAVAPSFAPRWSVWAAAYGGDARVGGDAVLGSSRTTSRLFGTAVGATYRFTPDTQAGFALGGAGSSFDLDGGFGGGRADVFNAAFYAKHNFGSAYLAALAGYSWQDTTTDRTVTIAGTDQLRANFKAQALAARLEGGWRYATPTIGITPYAALQSTTFDLPAYGETATSGSNTFALNYAAKTITATRGELGAKFDKAMLVQSGVFTLKAKTAWAHDWNTDRAAIATFQALPGATFTVNGALPSANAALASLGAEMKWHNGWTLAASFDGEFSRTTAGYAGKGSVKYEW
jgi:uncharacterized protein with beta-barrel porin domain